MKQRKTMIFILLFSLSLIPIYAASINDPIIEIPKGTIFTLNDELEIPANRNFVLLGVNRLSQSFNQINQTYNLQNNNYYNNFYGNYYTYNTYFSRWRESTNKSYQDCLYRHRIHYSYDNQHASTNNNVIVNNAYGNTNVIINNNQVDTAPTYGSVQGRNTCIKPEQTIAVLLINKEKAQSGGFFKEGYNFKVRRVSYSKQGHFYSINILFDHKVLKGIRIVTNIAPQRIKIHQLQANQNRSNDFWGALGDAFEGMVNIGGDYFSIELPSKRYYD